MLEQIMQEFPNKDIPIENIFISTLIDEFYDLYKNYKLSSMEQLDCLEFINTLFRLKHKFIIDYNKEKRTFKRNTQLYHLMKIQKFAKFKIKKIYRHHKHKPSQEVVDFKKLISALNRKMKHDTSMRTKMLLDELMKERWTVQDKANFLWSILKDNKSKEVNFDDMIETQDREEIITSFFALLDMKKKNEIDVLQKRNFGEIIIKRNC